MVGLIAAMMLAGTGITTYICPVSVSVVVMSRTTAPFLRSRHPARVKRFGRIERIVPILIVAVGKFGGVGSLFHDHALGHELRR